MPGRDGLPDFAGWTQQQVADFWAHMNQYRNGSGTIFAPSDERGKPAQGYAQQVADDAQREAGLRARNLAELSDAKFAACKGMQQWSTSWPAGAGSAGSASDPARNVCACCGQPFPAPL